MGSKKTRTRASTRRFPLIQTGPRIAGSDPAELIREKAGSTWQGRFGWRECLPEVDLVKTFKCGEGGSQSSPADFPSFRQVLESPNGDSAELIREKAGSTWQGALRGEECLPEVDLVKTFKCGEGGSQSSPADFPSFRQVLESPNGDSAELIREKAGSTWQGALRGGGSAKNQWSLLRCRRSDTHRVSSTSSAAFAGFDSLFTSFKTKKHPIKGCSFVLAEKEGVEPSHELPRLKL